jgi:hypothetical protein
MHYTPLVLDQQFEMDHTAYFSSRGCSSLGRAVGSQSAGTGIETLLLQFLSSRGLYQRVTHNANQSKLVWVYIHIVL